MRISTFLYTLWQGIRNIWKNKMFSLASIATMSACIFLFGIFVKNDGILKNFMTSVAIAVAAIPEGLPAVVTIIMAMGVQKMSKKKVVIRKLKSVKRWAAVL